MILNGVWYNDDTVERVSYGWDFRWINSNLVSKHPQRYPGKRVKLNLSGVTQGQRMFLSEALRYEYLEGEVYEGWEEEYIPILYVTLIKGSYGKTIQVYRDEAVKLAKELGIYVKGKKSSS